MENFNSNKEVISNNDLQNLLTDLKKYDSDHGQGRWMGMGLAGFIMANANPENKDYIKNKAEKNMTINEVVDRNKDILQKLGIELQSANPNSLTDSDEIYAVGYIKMNIVDGEKTLSFFKYLNPELLTKEQIELIRMISEKLLNQLEKEYIYDDVDDRLLGLISIVKKLAMQYQRVGFLEEANDFLAVSHWAKEGCLREFVLLKRRGFFEPIGTGFNFSTFQIDATTDVYRDKWEVAFKTLDEIKKNDNAGELYTLSLDYLKESIKYAVEDKVLGEDRFKEKQFSGIRGVMDDISERLEEY